MVILLVALVLVIGGVTDTVANWGKAYRNVSIGGVDVSGMNAEEMQNSLKSTFGLRVSHAQVTIFADEEARERSGRDLSNEERRAIAEQISTEEASSAIGSWATDALALKATVPYESAVDEALAVGRGLGGVFARWGLFLTPYDVPLVVQFDEGALEELASDIDRTIGDARIDATVRIEDGVAYPVEGHDGSIVDRTWLAERISGAMIRDDAPDSFIAEVSPAPSRITLEQAERTSEAVNRALSAGAVFRYNGSDWVVSADDLGQWTRVAVAPAAEGYALQVGIDASSALPAVVKGAGAAITSDDMTVRFEKDGGTIMVYTAGSGGIPEVSPAVAALDQALYGQDGIAWGEGDAAAALIEIGRSDKPEQLGFDQAIDLGIVTAIGEYTTEFSNQEGTENRNHNIKLAADILNDGIVKADGGIWSFNDEAGDTNEDAGFWSAGSIVDGEYVDSIGGGICQVATTVFNAVYEAGLDVVTRHNHTLYIASYPTGRDAAVSYPDLDFAWKNELPSDVLLRLSCTDTSVTAQLYSVYTGYTVASEQGAWLEGDKYKTRFEEVEWLATGASYLRTIGEDGSSTSVERTVRNRSGAIVRQDVFYSNYDPKDEVYAVGPDTDTSSLARKVDSGEDDALRA